PAPATNASWHVQSVKRAACAPTSQSQGGDLPLHGGRPEPSRNLRPEAVAQRTSRPAKAEGFRRSQISVRQNRRKAAWHQADVPQARPERDRDFGSFPARRYVGGSPGGDSFLLR